MAAAADRLGSSINEISRQVSHATEVAREADEAGKGFAVVANEAITKKIGEINSVTTSIASAIEEQNAATRKVNQNIAMVSDASVETEGMATDVMRASSELSQQAEMIHTHTMSFRQNVGVEN